MKGSEITLVLFTLLMQTAVGFTIIFGFVNFFTHTKTAITGWKEISEKMLLVVCLIFIAGLIISFLHLGNIKNAVYVLNNISGSWLSREILFTIIFGLFLFTFAFVSYKQLLSEGLRMFILAGAVISGAALVFVMAKIYMIETVPAWNTFYTPASFVLSSLILGGILFTLMLYFSNYGQGAGGKLQAPIQLIIKTAVAVLLLLVLIEIISISVHALILSKGERAARESFLFLTDKSLILFALRYLFLAGIVVMSFILYRSAAAGTIKHELFYVILALSVLSEILGRYLFYAIYNRVGI